MSGKFPNLSWWLWSGKKKDGKLQKISSVNSAAESTERKLGGGNLGFIDGRVVRKGRRCEQGKIDGEHNSLVVPFNGGGFSSDSESDGSDWSIGWSEPHAPGFLSEDEIDGGFGVLVRCYGLNSGGKPDNNENNVKSISDVPDFRVADSQKHMESWLSSLQGGS